MTQERPPETDQPQLPDAPAVAPEAGPISHSQATHAPAALASLKQAMRRARFDDAERLGAMADLRAARVGRLELLAEALQPLVAQIPDDVDLFDFGLMPGTNPRLFLDMIGFVEMGRDARTYRLVQDTRHGRTILAESDSVPRMVEVATDYVARRLLERDKALAADADDAAATPGRIAAPKTAAPETAAANAGAASGKTEPRRRGARVAGALGIAFAMLIDLLGAIAFFAILFSAGWFIWARLHGQA